MYRTVIFDLDGTLLNTLDDLCDSVNYSLEKHKLPQRSLAEVRRFVGNGIRKLIERAVPCNTSLELTDRVYETFKEHYGVHCFDKTAPYGGIPELIAELSKRGIKCGIASNKYNPAVQELNERFFEGLIAAARGLNEGEPAKPDAHIVNCVMQELNADRDTTLYVGDSQVDVMTARNTGLRMVAVLWGFRDYDELCEAGATEFVSEPSELLRYFE